MTSEDPEKFHKEIKASNEGDSPENKTEGGPPVTRPVIEIPDPILQEYRAYQEQQDRENKINRRVAVAAVLGAWVYAGIATFQWCTMQRQLNAMQASNAQNERTFQTTQRAAVYLGLPNGKIADFLPGEDVQRLVLYFRNYGPTTAQNTIIEFWPITSFVGQPYQIVRIPPPHKSANLGADIPPGFPHAMYTGYPDATRDVLNSGQKSLRILGRIRYRDVFRTYCDVFAIEYAGKPISQFLLTPNLFGHMGICGEEEQTISLGDLPQADKPNSEQK